MFRESHQESGLAELREELRRVKLENQVGLGFRVYG